MKKNIILTDKDFYEMMEEQIYNWKVTQDWMKRIAFGLSLVCVGILLVLLTN